MVTADSPLGLSRDSVSAYTQSSAALNRAHWKRAALIGVTMVLLGVTPVPARAQTDVFDGFDAYVESAMAEWQVPGLAIVVLRGDDIIYSQAFGVREVGKPDPVDLETIFALSSTGKAYTATLIGTGVDTGEIGWDDPVSDHLDHFRLPDPWVTDEVTIRDLMSHRVSGDLGVGKLEIWAFTDLERDEVLRGLRTLEPGPQRFRSAFQYSNPNISAAGQALGAALGRSWDDLMQTRILDGLGMQRATTTVRALWDEGDYAACYMCDLDRTPGHEEAKVDNVAMPHVGSENGPVPIPWRTVDNIGPAGSINSSVLDFARFVQLHLGKGVIDGRRIVSEAAIAEMHAPQMIVRNPPYPAGQGFGRLWAYGLGWWVSEYRGHELVMHTGGVTGWRSAMVMLPDESLGVAVVSNGHGAHLPNTLAPALAFVAFDRVLGVPVTDRAGEWLAMTHQGLAAAESAMAALYDARDVSASASVGADVLGGTYEHPGFGRLTIDAAAGRISLRGVMEGTLEHWQHDTYRVSWIGPWPVPAFLDVSVDLTGQPIVELRGFGEFSKIP